MKLNETNYNCLRKMEKLCQRYKVYTSLKAVINSENVITDFFQKHDLKFITTYCSVLN